MERIMTRTTTLFSYLGHLSQATGVGVLVEEDLVGHLLPDLSLGPLLLSSETITRKDTQV